MSGKGFQPFNSWFPKKSIQKMILTAIGHMEKCDHGLKGKVLQDKGFLRDFPRDAILSDFAYWDLVFIEVRFWKPCCPIVWMSIDWKGIHKVSNNCIVFSSHADSLLEEYIPVSMASAIFSLPMYVSVSVYLNPFTFFKEENVMITGCVGGNTGFWSLNHIGLSSSPPLISEGMNSPSVESPCLTAAIC